MIDGYAVCFACAIALGWMAAIAWGKEAERDTMSLLTLVWMLTIAVNVATLSPAPVEFYGALDIAVIAWLLKRQRNNWQWLPVGLATTMFLAHIIFWVGTQTGNIVYSGRPYQDILAGLGYFQIVATGWASYERSRARRRHWFARLGHWALATDWIPRRRFRHTHHAGQR